MFNLDDIANENNKYHNLKWPYIPDHPYRMLIIGDFGSGQTTALLNLIKEQDSESLIDKIYLYPKGLNVPKYQFLIKKRKNIGTKHLKHLNEYSQCTDDVDNNIDDCNPSRKRKKLIVFDDMMADIMSNKKFQSIIKELFIRCRKLNISYVFIIQSYFSVPKEVILNSKHSLIMKIHNRRELQSVAANHSADINYQDFMKIYRKCTSEPYSFLTIDSILPFDNLLRFRKNLLNPL